MDDMDAKTLVTAETEDEQLDVDFPVTIFSVSDILYGVSARYVLSIEILGEVTPIIDSPHYRRGIINFRGDMIAITDLRALFGIGSMVEQMDNLMQARIGDHERWMTALENAAATGTHFTLTTDAHACAFGKWYDTFKTDSNSLIMLLGKIDRPHKLLHASAIDVNEAIARNRLDEAQKLVEHAKQNYFTETCDLLRKAAEAYASDTNEMLIVLEVEGHVFGLIVDKIVSVEAIRKMLPVPEGSQGSGYVECLGKRGMDDGTVLFLDVGAMNRL